MKRCRQTQDRCRSERRSEAGPVLFLLNGLQVCSAVVGRGREHQRDTVHGHAHPPEHRAEAVVHRYGHTHSYLRLYRSTRSSPFHSCFLPTETRKWTHSLAESHSNPQEIGVVHYVVVGKSGSLRTASSTLKRTTTERHDVTQRAFGDRETLTDVNWMLMGSSQDSLLCRSISSLWCRLSPASITSFTCSIPGCRLSVTITRRKSGNLGKGQCIHGMYHDR